MYLYRYLYPYPYTYRYHVYISIYIWYVCVQVSFQAGMYVRMDGWLNVRMYACTFCLCAIEAMYRCFKTLNPNFNTSMSRGLGTSEARRPEKLPLWSTSPFRAVRAITFKGNCVDSRRVRERKREGEGQGKGERQRGSDVEAGRSRSRERKSERERERESAFHRDLARYTICYNIF